MTIVKFLLKKSWLLCRRINSQRNFYGDYVS